MLDTRQKAEVYRLGMIVGHFEPKDAVNWADLVIAEEDKPDNAILEISMAGDANTAQMVSLLKDAAGDQQPGAPRDVFFGLLSRKVAGDPASAESVAHQLKTLRSAYDQPDAVMTRASELAGPFTHGDAAAASKAVVDFLAPYAGRADHWK